MLLFYIRKLGSEVKILFRYGPFRDAHLRLFQMLGINTNIAHVDGDMT